MDNVAALLADVDRCNNGVIRHASYCDAITARKNPKIFSVWGFGMQTSIARKGHIFDSPPKAAPSQLPIDDFDYEAAILSRQSIDF